MRIRFHSPTVKDWIETIKTQRAELLDVRPQMNVLLEAIREDIDSQFDENQSKWKPLRPFTLDKKESLDADLRILHETREGQGLRLRDAYKQAGKVTNDGTLIWDYPIQKPYAEELDKGAVVAKSEKATGGTRRKPSGKKQDSYNDKLDDEYYSRFGVDTKDIFKLSKVEYKNPQPKKKRKKRR